MEKETEEQNQSQNPTNNHDQDKGLGTGTELLMEDEILVLKEIDNTVRTVQTGQSPLDKQVINRGYTERQYTGDTVTPIEEPSEPRQVIAGPSSTQQNTTAPPPLSKDQIIDSQNKDRQYAGQVMGEKEMPRTGGNPAVQTMSNKERQQNLDISVETAIDVYAKGKEWLGSWVTISDSNLIARQDKGKTPADWAVLYDSSTNEVMTLREFVKQGNKLIEAACKTDEDFKNRIRPILKAEFDRRNWILSPQNNGLIVIGADLFSTGQKLFTVYMNMQKVLKRADKEFEERQKTGFMSARDLYNQQLNYMRHNPQAQQPTAVPQQDQNIQQPPQQTPSTQVKPQTENITLPAEDELSFEPPAN